MRPARDSRFLHRRQSATAKRRCRGAGMLIPLLHPGRVKTALLHPYWTHHRGASLLGWTIKIPLFYRASVGVRPVLPGHPPPAFSGLENRRLQPLGHLSKPLTFSNLRAYSAALWAGIRTRVLPPIGVPKKSATDNRSHSHPGVVQNTRHNFLRRCNRTNVDDLRFKCKGKRCGENHPALRSCPRPDCSGRLPL